MTPSKNAKNKFTAKDPSFVEPTFLSMKQSNSRCAVSGCHVDNNNDDVVLFPLPIQVIFNRHLAIKWRSILSFDQPLTKNTVLCERHFERKFISTSIFTGKPKLDPTAIPSKSTFEVQKKEVAIVQPVVKPAEKRKLGLESLDDHSCSVPPKKSIQMRFFSEPDFENYRSKEVKMSPRFSDVELTSDESSSSSCTSSSSSSSVGGESNCEERCVHKETGFTSSSENGFEERNCDIGFTKIQTPSLSGESGGSNFSENSGEDDERLYSDISKSSDDPLPVEDEILNVFIGCNDDNASDVFQIEDK